ncbi:hypothetical protein ABK040_005003 [Willaertia magna]
MPPASSRFVNNRSSPTNDNNTINHNGLLSSAAGNGIHLKVESFNVAIDLPVVGTTTTTAIATTSLASYTPHQINLMEPTIIKSCTTNINNQNNNNPFDQQWTVKGEYYYSNDLRCPTLPTPIQTQTLKKKKVVLNNNNKSNNNTPSSSTLSSPCQSPSQLTKGTMFIMDDFSPKQQQINNNNNNKVNRKMSINSSPSTTSSSGSRIIIIMKQLNCLFYVQTCEKGQDGKLVVKRKRENEEKRKRREQQFIINTINVNNKTTYSPQSTAQSVDTPELSAPLSTLSLQCNDNIYNNNQNNCNNNYNNHYHHHNTSGYNVCDRQPQINNQYINNNNNSSFTPVNQQQQHTNEAFYHNHHYSGSMIPAITSNTALPAFSYNNDNNNNSIEIALQNDNNELPSINSLLQGELISTFSSFINKQERSGISIRDILN